MSKRLLLEVNKDFLPAIKRRKKEFFQLLDAAMKEEESKKALMTRFGTNLIAESTGYDKVVINMDGETVFRR